MNYKFYRGYILGLGEQHPTYDIYEVEIFENRSQAERGVPTHTSASVLGAQGWIDRYIEVSGLTGVATSGDVDELNRVAPIELGFVDPEHKMEIEVNSSVSWIDVSDWCRYHEIELQNAIDSAVKGLGFGGRVDIRVRY